MKSLSLLVIAAATMATASPVSSNRPQPATAITDQDVLNSCQESNFEPDQCRSFHAKCFQPVREGKTTLEDCKADFEKKSEPKKLLTDQDLIDSCKQSDFQREQCIQFHAKCFNTVREGKMELEDCKADFVKETSS
ncbi:hypothetical protein CP533_2546 [Ophiocordyceps camponoti-saundersi (nom. inval.)]|nr:hypothetical protein CP533_2546 [Ophiocordyceps camponoti-saundersi (nom. inval.)]